MTQDDLNRLKAQIDAGTLTPEVAFGAVKMLVAEMERQRRWLEYFSGVVARMDAETDRAKSPQPVRRSRCKCGNCIPYEGPTQ